MNSLLAYSFVQILIAAAGLGVGITCWSCASIVGQMTAESSMESGRLVWYRVVGWLLAWFGALTVFALAVGSAAIAVTQVQLVTLPPVAILVGIVSVVNLIAVIRATSGTRLWLMSEAEAFAATPAESRTRWQQAKKSLTGPLVLVTICLGATAFGGILFGLASSGLFVVDEQQSVAFLGAALLAEAVTFVGLSLAISAELITLPWTAVDPRQRAMFSRILTIAAVFCLLKAFGLFLVGIGLLVVFNTATFLLALVLLLLCVILVVSTFGGRYRAAELASFWAFSFALKTGAPLETELADQAASADGRSSYLLGVASQQLAEGVPLEEVAFVRGLVPRSSWLEVSAAMSSGRLSAALEAAAARETERFSRAWSPGMARGSLAYFGVLWGLLVLIFGFVLYYIVPKFKKILEDFDVEMPPPMRSFLLIMDNDLVISLFVLFGLTFLITAITVELLVDYYGWEGMLERFGSRFRLRFATPDLLRGLKWAVLARKPFDGVLQDMAATPVTFLVKSGLHRAAGGLRQGEDPWTVLHNVGWIRREEAELLRCAQAAGNLPWALDTLSQSIGLRRSYRVEWWLQASHPVLVLSAAAFVGWFAMAMFSPLTHMLNVLS